MRKLIFILALFPVWAWGQTITSNGNYQTITCQSGEGRVEVYDGGGGYDSGTVELQFDSRATGAWENLCPTATDCQWTTGDSGAVPFDIGTGGGVRLNLSGVASSADIDVSIQCRPDR